MQCSTPAPEARLLDDVPLPMTCREVGQPWSTSSKQEYLPERVQMKKSIKYSLCFHSADTFLTKSLLSTWTKSHLQPCCWSITCFKDMEQLLENSRPATTKFWAAKTLTQSSTVMFRNLILEIMPTSIITAQISSTTIPNHVGSSLHPASILRPASWQTTEDQEHSNKSSIICKIGAHIIVTI